jgi:tetratricopeptide (TPR) repeat protein
MSLQQLPEAIQSYGRVVQIDNGQAFVWANLANLYMATGKKAEAMSTIEQAAKLNDNRWKVWCNYAAIAFENQKFPKFVRAVLKLVDLDKCEAIEDPMIKRLVVAFNLSIEAVREKPEEIRSTELLYRDITTIFQKLTNKQPQRHAVWKMYSDFLHFDFAFYSLKRGLRNLDPTKTRVFMVEEPTLEVEEYRKISLNRRFEVTLKECQSVMRIGWENEM